jgi:hypothetical protein
LEAARIYVRRRKLKPSFLGVEIGCPSASGYITGLLPLPLATPIHHSFCPNVIVELFEPVRQLIGSGEGNPLFGLEPAEGSKNA